MLPFGTILLTPLFGNMYDRKGKGAVFVGINPAKPSKRSRRGLQEREFYKKNVKNGNAYEQVLKYWENEIHGKFHRYYTPLGKLADQLSLTGPILWTELVKCENAPSEKVPPLQTFRICTHAYLMRELKSVPDDWPIIAIGQETYDRLVFLAPGRVIIGVPHPASNGYFSKLVKRLSRIDVSLFWDTVNAKAQGAIWLPKWLSEKSHGL